MQFDCDSYMKLRVMCVFAVGVDVCHTLGLALGWG